MTRHYSTILATLSAFAPIAMSPAMQTEWELMANDFPITYPNLLTQEELDKLDQMQFITYLRNQLWLKEAAKRGVRWEDIPFVEKMTIDTDCVIVVMTAIHKVHDEEETDARESEILGQDSDSGQRPEEDTEQQTGAV